MHRRICLLILLLALMAASAGVPGQTPRIFLSAPSTEVESGEELNLELRLDTDGQPVKLLGIFLQFNAARFAFQSGLVNKPLFDSNVFTSEAKESEPGIISFSAGSNTTVNGDGLLVATLTFVGKSGGVGDFSFLTTPPRETTVEDASFTPLASTFDPAQIRVIPRVQAAFELAPSLVTTTSGTQVLVDVMFQPNGASARTVDVYLDFDPAMLQFEEGTVNRPVFDVVEVTTDPRESGPGRIHFAAESQSDLPDETISIGTVRFLAIAEGTTRLALSHGAPASTRAWTGTDEPIAGTLTGSMVIIGATSTGTPRLSMTPGWQEIVEGDSFRLGAMLDANQSGTYVVQGYLPFDGGKAAFDAGELNLAVFGGTTFRQAPVVIIPDLVQFSAESTGTLAANSLAVATMDFTSGGTGTATFQFSTASGRVTSALDTGLDEINTLLDPATVRIVDGNPCRLTLSPTPAVGPPGSIIQLTVTLDTRGRAVKSGQAFLYIEEDGIEFLQGSVNHTLFNDTILTSDPELNGRVVSFSFGSTTTVVGSDLAVATLDFRIASPFGRGKVLWLEDAPGNTQVTGEGFVVLPLSTEDGIVRPQGSNLLMFF